MASDSTSAPSAPSSALEQRPLPSIINHLARLWIFTGFVASMVAVGVALLVSKTGANILSQVLVAIACGSLAAFAMAPWRHVQALMNRAQLLGRLRDMIIDMQAGDRTDSIRELASRTDEVGALCQAVDDLLGTIVSQRVRAHSLKRTMHETIRKETTRATATLRREAMTDSLTGIGNRRALEEFEQRLHSTAPTRPETRIAAMVIDVDDFKQLNDTVGHRQGDECLKFIGTVLQASTRREDCALRLGGDEFLVLMLDRSREEMHAVAERVVSLLRQMPWPGGAGEPPTVSIGIAEALLRDVRTIDALVESADAAMYRAKNSNSSSIGAAWDASDGGRTNSATSAGAPTA